MLTFACIYELIFAYKSFQREYKLITIISIPCYFVWLSSTYGHPSGAGMIEKRIHWKITSILYFDRNAFISMFIENGNKRSVWLRFSFSADILFT